MSERTSDIRSEVQEFYAQRVKQADSCCGTGETCAPLYEQEMLIELPEDLANFSMGCGDPITLGSLQPGESVLDLGSGGGLDCFLAAQQVGVEGFVIGVDMTPEMLARARGMAERMGVDNVDFWHGFLEDLPVEDESIDVVISNCVINLSPDKPRVFEEIHRVLKPSGRLSISDIVSQGDLPEEIKGDTLAWSACAAGALPAEEFASALRAVGFVDVDVVSKDEADVAVAEIPSGTLFSGLITARKPTGEPQKQLA